MHVMEIAGPAASATPLERALPFLVALMFLIAPLANPPLLAQGLDSEESIDAIVGSDVKTGEAANEEQAERVVAAIENTIASAESVRKAFNLNTLEIVFLPGDTETGPIGEAVAEHREEIVALQESIEGSAMFYHAVDSRSIMLRDIVAVEFGDNDVVTIFVNGRER